jgi:oxygen-independent coproporphyrinogen-3 oxidase
VKEIETYSRCPYIDEGVYDAVYFGGGTPTTLSPTGFREILRTLRTDLNISSKAEITVETTVSDLTEDRIAVLKDEGVNRISIGVQTFCNKGRRLLGRVGTGQHAVERLSYLSDEGFANVGMDLMYNYPSQSEEDLEKDLEAIELLDLAGVSFYSLILREGAPLYRMMKKGKCPPLGDSNRELLFFSTILGHLKDLGFNLLELTKLVQPGRDNYEYIRIRYENGDTLGLGAGAGGRLGNMLYMNPLDVDAYRQQVNSSAGLPAIGFGVDHRYNFAYYVIGRLQFGNLKWSDLSPYDSYKYLRRLADELEREGLTVSNSGGFSLTKEGVFWGNNIGREFATTLADLLGPNASTVSID